MNNKMDDDRAEKSFAATAAARPTSKDMNRRQTDLTPETGMQTDDSLVNDMKSVANDTVLDGNAQVNSPQAGGDDEGSPGNSR
jgi:hypothetical protein